MQRGVVVTPLCGPAYGVRPRLRNAVPCDAERLFILPEHFVQSNPRNFRPINTIFRIFQVLLQDEGFSGNSAGGTKRHKKVGEENGHPATPQGAARRWHQGRAGRVQHHRPARRHAPARLPARSRRTRRCMIWHGPHRSDHHRPGGAALRLQVQFPLRRSVPEVALGRVQRQGTNPRA